MMQLSSAGTPPLGPSPLVETLSVRNRAQRSRATPGRAIRSGSRAAHNRCKTAHARTHFREERTRLSPGDRDREKSLQIERSPSAPASRSLAHRRGAIRWIFAPKFFKQDRSGPMQPRPDRTHWAAKRRRRLFVTHLLELAENDDLSVIFWERRNGLAHAADCFQRGEFVVARCLQAMPMAVSVARDCGARCKFLKLVCIALERYQPAILLPALPEMVARDAAKDRKS